MNRQQRRQRDREMSKMAGETHKMLRKMSEQEIEDFLLRMFANSADTVGKVFEEVLREDFGFGAKRMERLRDGVKRKLAE